MMIGADDEDDDEDGDDTAIDDEAEGNEDEDRGRQITSYAGDSAARARGRRKARSTHRGSAPAGARAAEKFEHRRRAVVEILGALRHRLPCRR